MDSGEDVKKSNMVERDAFEAAPEISKFKKNGKLLMLILEKWLQQSPDDMTLNLHRYQVEAVLETLKRVLKELQNLKNQTGQSTAILEPLLITAPTGSGKSGIITMLAYVLQPLRVVLVTPSKTISEQNEKSFYPVNGSACFFEITGLQTKRDKLEALLEIPKVVTCANDISNYRQLGNLVIVTAQRFGGKAKTSLVYKNQDVIEDVEEFFKRFDLLIVDEAHHYPATTWKKIIEEFTRPAAHNKIIIFLTATPYKNGPKGNPLFILGKGKEDRIVYEVLRENIEGKSIRKCEFRESTRPFSKASLFDDIVDILDQQGRMEKRFIPRAMVLVRTRREAKDLVDYINKFMGSIFAVALLSTNEGSTSKSVLEQFTKGPYFIGVTCGIGLEGYDNPKVTLCVVARKIVNGRILLSQFSGRCQRLNRDVYGTEPDKTMAVVLSYKEFAIRGLWESLNLVAEEDPSDDFEN